MDPAPVGLSRAAVLERLNEGHSIFPYIKREKEQQCLLFMHILVDRKNDLFSYVQQGEAASRKSKIPANAELHEVMIVKDDHTHGRHQAK